MWPILIESPTLKEVIVPYLRSKRRIELLIDFVLEIFVCDLGEELDFFLFLLFF